MLQLGLKRTDTEMRGTGVKRPWNDFFKKKSHSSKYRQGAWRFRRYGLEKAVLEFHGNI